MGIPTSYCSCVRDCNDNIIEAKFMPNNNIEFPEPLTHVTSNNNNDNKQQTNDDTDNIIIKLPKMSTFVTKQTLDSVGDELLFKCNKKKKSDDNIINIQSTFRGFSYRKKFLNNIKENLINSNKDIISSYEKLYTSESNMKIPTLIENSFNEKNTKNNNKLKTNCLIKTYDNNEDCLYKGEIDIDKNFNGYGELFLKNGKKYEGFFKNNKLNGEGKFYDTNNTLYEGNFIDNILTGKGKITKINDNNTKIIYEGEIENFKKSGYGKEITPDYTYEGNFKNDMKNGKGKLIYLEGDNYEGEFKDGEITGKGHYIWSNQHEYNGTFINGKMHGKGIYLWPDGSQYDGDYVNNIKEGNGQFKWKDGKIFKGPFSKGKPNGVGVMIVDGNMIECEFREGKYLNVKNRTKSKSTGEVTGSN